MLKGKSNKNYSLSKQKMNITLVLTLTVMLASLIHARSWNLDNRSNDFELCEPPPCTKDQINTLWPHHNKKLYYQCVPDPGCGWKPLERPCAPGTVFGFKEQVCIWDCDWIDPCGNTTTVAPTTTSIGTPPTPPTVTPTSRYV